MRKIRPIEDRFWEKVDKRGPIPEYAPHLGRCWMWKASKNDQGYGQLARGRGLVPWKAHRLSWLIDRGSLPEPPLELDHLCHVRACVRPSHLEPVTHKVNAERGDRSAFALTNKAKTHCPSNHPYDEANKKFIPSRPGERFCRACQKIANREYQRRKREKV